ncbi:MAG: UDP-N-acetylmuramoyl-L-alanine--D-glutamate ligase [Candidatus Microsaccharimonas sp.]
MKIAIVAYGLEGKASYTYYSKNPSNDITIFDQNAELNAPEGVKTVLGTDAFEKLEDYDLILRSPPISPHSLKTRGKIWSVTNEFFEKCPVPIIGVTGTKGKGTTSSMIASIFEATGKKVWLVGNFGLAALDVLDQIQPDDIVVYELSSFQLWDIERSPYVAVVLPIEPEHLDVHKDFEDYVDAKAHITRFQSEGDICVYNPTNEYSRSIGERSGASNRFQYTTKTPGSVYVEEGFFKRNEQIICSVSELQLRGDHNKENACAAITVAHELGVSNDDIAAGIRNFKGLPHRIEFVRNVDGVDYYNDSFSSSTPATYAAICAFEQPEIVIMGGVDRGGDFEHFAGDISGFTNLKEFVLIGEIRHKLADILQGERIDTKITVLDATTMKEIVEYARSQARSGDVIILSPGCASFDMFKDFYDRGDQFREVVNAL